MDEAAPKVEPEARSAMLLAQLSHEIRAPLTGIRLLMQSIAVGHMPSKLFDEVEQSVQYLINLSDAYLHRVRAQTQGHEPLHETFELAIVVREVIDLVKRRAHDKKLQLIVDWHRVNLCVTGNPLAVKQILINLLSNAIQFTPHGHVHVAACVAPTALGGFMLTLLVSDTGPGMGSAHARRAFEPFVRLDPREAHPGHGLGLSIVKELTEASGGDVMAIDSPAGGLQVLATLKVARVIETPVPLWADADKDAGAQPCCQPRASAKAGNEPTPREQLPHEHHGKSVLLVEDNPVNQIIVGDYLRSVGFHVLTAENGADALAVLAHENVDLVLTDLSMPVLDGAGMVREIRRQGMDLPVVALTGATEPEVRLSCSHAGMTAYLTKPLDLDHAIHDLVAALSHRHGLKNSQKHPIPTAGV